MARRTGPTNPVLKGLILQLKKRASEKNEKIWHRIAEELEAPARMRRAVNLYRIAKHAGRQANKNNNENEIVIVPGKVLGTGEISQKLLIAAYSFSESAREKIHGAKGEAITIAELLQKNPKPQNIRIIG